MKHELMRQVTSRQIRTAIVHYAEYELRVVEEEFPPRYRLKKLLDVPCRSNLNRLLTNLFFGGDFRTDDAKVTEIPEEQVRWIEILMDHQKDYNFWRAGLAVFNSKGKEETLVWMREKLPLLRLKEKIE